MSPTPVDPTTRKRKLSENSDLVSLTSNDSDTTPKRSRLTSAKDSLYKVFSWISDSTRKALTRETLVQPISYVSKVWDELSHSINQSYEYQGPELEGPEMITSVPTLVPMSNVGLTASSGMSPSNLATNTTFINLAPQPSLPPLGTSSNLHSGNANLNHPLQSLHAMHPGGGDLLTTEVSSQEAAAAVAFAVQQQQSYQLSLSRANTGTDSGKYSRGSNGFAPTGFSTPLVSVSTAQSRLGNRSVFPLGIGASHNMSVFSASKSRSQERAPIRFKKAFKPNSTHEKIFSPRPKTTLRSTSRSDSPAVPNVFRHLLKKARRKPHTVKQSINLEEKKMYLEMLKANGFRYPEFHKTSDSSQERSRASSVATVESKSSGFSGSPPIPSEPSNGSTTLGSRQKPISLADEVEDDDPVFVREVASPTLVERRIEEVLLEDETPSSSSVDVSSSDKEDDDVIECNADAKENKNVEAVEEIEEIGIVILNKVNSSTSSATPSPVPSIGKPAFFVEKEIPATKLVDLTGGEEKVVTSSGQYERKLSTRRVSIPTEPEFMKSVRQSPYSDPKWIANIKHGILVDKNKNEINAKEQEAHLTVLRDERDAQDRDLVDRLRNKLKLSQRLKPEVEEVFIESSEEESEEEEEDEDKDFPSLTEDINDEIDAATSPGSPMEVLSSAFKLDITRKDIRTLVGLEWLNDEIINFYMNMLVDRSEKSEGALPKVYTFNTFFYPTLVKDGYARLKRWTRKVDLFSHDMIIIPVHLQMHWCLAVIDLATKEIRYYDSMGGNNQKCLNALKSYIQEEHKDKKQSPLDLEGWHYECVKDIPQQMNGSDCGMFTCKFAEYNTRRAPINFTQQHMPYFRRRMIYEIISLKLM